MTAEDSSSTVPLDLETLTLAHGSHDSREEGVCLLEAVAWVAGEEHSDHPGCVSPLIAAFGRSWNDSLNDEDRQQLKPFVRKMIGTRTTEADEITRAWMCWDWLIRTFTPAWLRLAGLTAEAQALESLARIVDAKTVDLAKPAIAEAKKKSAAAWAAAWAAARAAAGDAARDAAWAAAGAKLRPVVEELQTKALQLLDELIEVGKKAA